MKDAFKPRVNTYHANGQIFWASNYESPEGRRGRALYSSRSQARKGDLSTALRTDLDYLPICVPVMATEAVPA